MSFRAIYHVKDWNINFYSIHEYVNARLLLGFIRILHTVIASDENILTYQKNLTEN